MTDTVPRQLVLTSMADVEPERQLFLWTGRIPMGTATIFAGRGGEGKSTFSLWLASHVTRGTLDGEHQGAPGRVLLVGHEDDLATIVVPRLLAANADMSLVSSVKVRTVVEGFELDEVPSLVDDLARIREAVQRTNARLIIVDPLTSVMAGANLDKTADVRKALNPFVALAGELGVAVVAIMHLRKGSGDTRDLMSGSHAFRDVARSVILFATDEDTGQRVATVDKSNYSEARGDSFAFELESTRVPVAMNEWATVARVNYLGDTDTTVDDIVNRPDPTDVTDLGENIGAVVDCVNAHPGGIRTKEVADQLAISRNAASRDLGRAVKRELIRRVSYGLYYPRATASPSAPPTEPGAPDALGALTS
ncbi:AAA family ATPase [Curtobacterium sp. MCBD17_035]|uniref:AAA family ATPase n=1 Tax=Curtobacterium sp. MCBD17_035 TaxID=2175673 RepID=UPI0015E8B8A3|nr:AAA family ATPase [Curtobacterium sp. MCBD17_035]WIB68072.1 AAA family ATPase [Curtobacterium sp. MCBD17_035]